MKEDNIQESPVDQHSDEELEAEIADRAYRYLLQVRDLDNRLMWTRSNIILLIQGGILAILASQFGNLADKHPMILLSLPAFGLATAYFWWRITKGGSFWVDYWESKLGAIEHKVTGNVKIFRDHPSRVKASQMKAQFRRMHYISIRRTLITATFVTILFWGFLCAYVFVWHVHRSATFLIKLQPS